MILQLSLFQIFFMALSIVGLSFSILYLFIGGHNYENEYRAEYERQERQSEKQKARSERNLSKENVVDITSGKGRSSQRVPKQRPAPAHRTSVGRTSRVAAPGMRVLEVNYKVVHQRSRWDEVTLDAISQITDRVATGR